MIALKYIGQGMKRDATLTLCELSKHKFYYRPKGKVKVGRPHSVQTQRKDKLVSNSEVITLIKEVQSNEDTNYGYQKMYYQLLLLGFTINHKKVYRLMKEAGLLKEKIKIGSEKKYVRYRTVTPERPLHVIEMDIKMVWLVGAPQACLYPQHYRYFYTCGAILVGRLSNEARAD